MCSLPLSLSPSLSRLAVALQLPEGLQMFACVIADIIERYGITYTQLVKQMY